MLAIFFKDYHTNKIVLEKFLLLFVGFFCCLRQGLSLYPWLTTLCRPRRPQTHKDQSASVSKMLESKVCASKSSPALEHLKQVVKPFPHFCIIKCTACTLKYIIHKLLTMERLLLASLSLLVFL